MQKGFTGHEGCSTFHYLSLYVRIQRGTGGPVPLKITKIIGFLINTGPDPPKNHEAAEPAFNVGPPWKHHLNNLLALLTRHCHFF